MRPLIIVLTFVLLVVIGCAMGREEPPEPAAATIEPAHLMTGLVLLHHHSLLTALSEPPTSVEEWESAEAHAALLVEAAEILLRHSSGSAASWQVAAGSLKAGGVATLQGLEARSLTEARTGFERLNTACSTCHLECGSGDAPPWK